MGGTLNGSGADIAVAIGAVALFAAIYIALKGGSADPLEGLAAWARMRGLEYVAPTSPEVVATFTRQLDGVWTRVSVSRVGRRMGDDLPTRLTAVTAWVDGVPETKSAAAFSAPVCVCQPSAWVLDREGHAVREPVPTGDAAFDALWSARGEVPDRVRLATPPGVRSRLLQPDAGGLVIEFSADAVAIPMPGVCGDQRELDRRVGLAIDLARMALSPDSRGE